MGNNVIYKSEVVSLRTRTGEPMVRSRSNFDNDGAVLVPYLQVVYPVFDRESLSAYLFHVLHYFVGPVPYTVSYYNRGTGPIWLTYPSCIGNETNLLNCSHYSVSYCSHSRDVGVQCPGRPLVVIN